MKNYKNFTNDCNYFDLKSLNDYTGFKHPIYSYIQKRLIEKLIYISPEEYLKRCANNTNMNYDEYTSKENIVNQKTVLKYADAMKNGDKFPIGFYTKEKNLQEGRHRALALIELNCELMPVIEISEVDGTDVIDLVYDLKDLTREEINKMYIEKGYNGISDLDWRELENYINYRL